MHSGMSALWDALMVGWVCYEPSCLAGTQVAVQTGSQAAGCQRPGCYTARLPGSLSARQTGGVIVYGVFSLVKCIR